MAIIDNNTPQQSQQQQQQPQPMPYQQAAQQQQQQGQRKSNSMDFFGFGGNVAFSLFSASSAAESYNEIFRVFDDLYTNHINTKEAAAKAIKITREDFPALDFSFIVVVGGPTTKSTNVRGVYSFLVESTGTKYEYGTESLNGKQIEVFRPSSVAFNDRYFEIVRARLSRELPNTEFRFIGETVIPAKFDSKNTEKIRMLAATAGMAVWTSIEKISKGFVDTNITNNLRNTNLTVDIKFGTNQVYDPLGHPIRADIDITCTGGNQYNPNSNINRIDNINVGDQSKVISRVTGYIDVLWAHSPLNPYYQQPAGGYPTQMYYPNLVITSMGSDLAYTPSTILLQLITALTSVDGNSWMSAFLPKQLPAGRVDYTDVGALNIEGNTEQNGQRYGEKIDIRASNFGTARLGQFLSALFHQGVFVSLDVPRADLQSWYLRTFVQASENTGPDGANARQEIIAAADNLTGGLFSQNFNPNDPIFLNRNNLIHLCSFTDEDHQVKDGRYVDYVAVLNWANFRNDLELIEEWSDTFTKDKFPIQERLMGRQHLIKAFCNENAEFRDIATRITFTSGFLSALLKSAQDSGLSWRINNPIVQTDFYSQRGSIGYGQQAAFQANMSGMINTGYSGVQGSNMLTNLYGFGRMGS